MQSQDHGSEDRPADPATGQPGPSMHARREMLLGIATGFVLPVGLYYLLRAFGVDPVIALLVGGAPALAKTLWTMIGKRKIDKISLFTMSLLVAGGLTSLITGSPQWLLARSGVFTGLIGLWLLASLRARPIAFEGILTFQKSEEAIAAWERNWRGSPEFRHVMRATTAIWGVGFLLEAVIRVVLAWTLPVDVVPMVTTVQFIVLIVLMLWIAPVYGRRYMARHGMAVASDGITAIPADAPSAPAAGEATTPRSPRPGSED